MEVVTQFFGKYYHDNHPRTLIFGINPGRFGAGITGVNFTAPRQLKQFCGIDHPFKDGSELSAEFIYDMINNYGGPESFYKKFFITSISPLGFTKNGININYYDDKDLLQSVTPFITDCIQKQVEMNVTHQTAFCIGGDKNLKFFTSLNQKHKWFTKIIPLPHPRFIMQYRRKQKDDFVKLYIDTLKDN